MCDKFSQNSTSQYPDINIEIFFELIFQEKWWNCSNYPNIESDATFLAFLDSWPDFLYLLNRLLRHVIIIADNGLIDVHLTLVDVVSRRLWVIGTSHFHKLTNECTHHCFYIFIIVITLKENKNVRNSKSKNCKLVCPLCPKLQNKLSTQYFFHFLFYWLILALGGLRQT